MKLYKMDKIQYLRREIHREKTKIFHQNGHYEGKQSLKIINSKMDKLRDELNSRRKRKLNRGEGISREKRSRRFQRK